MIRNIILGIAFATLAVSGSSCTSFELEGSVGKNPKGQVSDSAIIHGSFWWFDYWTPPAVTICDPGYEIARIETHQNALYFLTSLVSLGLYVPQEVEWWCVKKSQPKTKRKLVDDPNKE